MKFYVHFEGEYEFTLVVTWKDGDGTIAALKQKFIEAFHKKHGSGKTLSVEGISLVNERKKAFADSSDVTKVIEDGEDVYVVESQAPSAATASRAGPPKQQTTPQPAKPPAVAQATLPKPSSPTGTKPAAAPGQPTPALSKASLDALENRALKQYQENRYQEAIDGLSVVVAQDHRTTAYTARAAALVRVGKFQDAILDCNRCLVQDGASAFLFLSKGTALLRLGETRAALDCFNLAAQLTPPDDASLIEDYTKWIAVAKAALAKRLSVSNVDDVLKSVAASGLVQNAITLATTLQSKGTYDQAVQMFLEVLETTPTHKAALLQLGSIFANQANNYSRAIEYYTRGFIHYPADPDFIQGLAEAYYQIGDYIFASRCYNSLQKLAKTPAEQLNLQCKLARCLYLLGDIRTAWAIIVPILQEDSEHFEALFTYGLYVRADNQHDEACKVFLKMLMQQPENQVVREQFALSMSNKQGFEFIREQINSVPNAMTALSFLAIALKDWGEVEKAAILYEDALKCTPESATACLNYVHAVEIINEYNKAFQIMKDFFKANPNLHVGNLTCGHVYNAICHIDQLTDYASYKSPAQPDEAVVAKRQIPVKMDYPCQPMDKEYPQDELDLLALFCTLVKVVYINGALELIAPLAKLINPTREGRPIHTTTIRNEHAYFCCIDQLMSSHSFPLTDKPRIYIAGDSHSLCPAWRTLSINSKDYMLYPLLVTGLKVWHTRPESKFYPKVNFWNVVPTAPKGSTLIMMFGEIDCREGFPVSIQKCKYKTLEEAASVSVELYIDLLQKLRQDYDYKIYVHPPPPVLDITRAIVMTFTRLLKKRVLETAGLHWLDFELEMITTDDPPKLKPIYELDGTHLNPAYLKLISSSLEKLKFGV